MTKRTHSPWPSPTTSALPRLDDGRPVHSRKITPQDLNGLGLFQDQAVDLEAILVRQLEELLNVEWLPGVVGLSRETTNLTVLLLRVVLDELDVKVLLPLVPALVYCAKPSACRTSDGELRGKRFEVKNECDAGTY